MPRDNRIKEYIFSGALPTSGGNAIWATSDHSINGEILAVNWQTDTTADIFLNISGTAETVWSSTAPSGTNVQAAYPYVYGVNSVNTTGSPQVFFNRVVNAPLVLVGSAWEGKNITSLKVVYR